MPKYRVSYLPPTGNPRHVEFEAAIVEILGEFLVFKKDGDTRNVVAAFPVKNVEQVRQDGLVTDVAT